MGRDRKLAEMTNLSIHLDFILPQSLQTCIPLPNIKVEGGDSMLGIFSTQ